MYFWEFNENNELSIVIERLVETTNSKQIFTIVTANLFVVEIKYQFVFGNHNGKNEYFSLLAWVWNVLFVRVQWVIRIVRKCSRTCKRAQNVRDEIKRKSFVWTVCDVGKKLGNLKSAEKFQRSQCAQTSVNEVRTRGKTCESHFREKKSKRFLPIRGVDKYKQLFKTELHTWFNQTHFPQFPQQTNLQYPGRWYLVGRNNRSSNMEE